MVNICPLVGYKKATFVDGYLSLSELDFSGGHTVCMYLPFLTKCWSFFKSISQQHFSQILCVMMYGTFGVSKSSKSLTASPMNCCFVKANNERRTTRANFVSSSLNMIVTFPVSEIRIFILPSFENVLLNLLEKAGDVVMLTEILVGIFT